MTQQNFDNRAILGQDLDTLREKLGLSVGEACWLYGMSMTKWTDVVRTGANDPITKPNLALLVRGLSKWPEVNMFPHMPNAQDIYSRLQSVDPEFGLKRFAIMFGSETTAGYRWITLGSNLSTAIRRLFYVFQVLFDAAAQESAAAAREFVESWEAIVESEAQERGIERIFSVGCWTKPGNLPVGRPTLGQDLDGLREELGLSTMDAQLLYGMSATKWMDTAKGKFSMDPLDNVSLALLIRVLRNCPDICPIRTPHRADAVYARAKELYGDLPLRKFSTLFGCEVSSGYRWVTLEAKISPLLSRLFDLFMEKSLRFEGNHDALMQFANEWYDMVMTEGSVRGISDIFYLGVWELGEKEEEMLSAHEKRQEKREAKERALTEKNARREQRAQAKLLASAGKEAPDVVALKKQLRQANKELKKRSEALLTTPKKPHGNSKEAKAAKAAAAALMQAQPQSQPAVDAHA